MRNRWSHQILPFLIKATYFGDNAYRVEIDWVCVSLRMILIDIHSGNNRSNGSLKEGSWREKWLIGATARTTPGSLGRGSRTNEPTPNKGYAFIIRHF